MREAGGLGRMWANPVSSRLAVLSAGALAIIVLVGLGLFYRAPQRKTTSAVIPTRTAGPTPTYTLTPTAINETPFLPTAQPTFAGVPPLWAWLEATYTPTPVYVNTPHVWKMNLSGWRSGRSKMGISPRLSHIFARQSGSIRLCLRISLSSRERS